MSLKDILESKKLKQIEQKDIPQIQTNFWESNPLSEEDLLFFLILFYMSPPLSMNAKPGWNTYELFKALKISIPLRSSFPPLPLGVQIKDYYILCNQCSIPDNVIYWILRNFFLDIENPKC